MRFTLKGRRDRQGAGGSWGALRPDEAAPSTEPRRAGTGRARRFAIGLSIVAVVGLVVAVVGFSPRLLTSTIRKPLTRTPQDVGLTFKKVEFAPPDAPITLRAWWMPVPHATAALILVHGGGGNKSLEWIDGLELARDLIAGGYSVLALDLRNHGESDAAPDGRVTPGNAEANDVLGAIAYLTQQGVAQRFGIVGFSLGGAVALYAAARDPRIEAVVADGVYVDARGAALRNAQAATGWPGSIIDLILWSAETFHGYSFKHDSTLDAMSHIQLLPVLIIHNEADPIVPVDDARHLLSDSLAAQLWVTPAPPRDAPFWREAGPWGTHVRCYHLYPREFAARVLAFFDRVFTAPSALTGKAAPHRRAR